MAVDDSDEQFIKKLSTYVGDILGINSNESWAESYDAFKEFYWRYKKDARFGKNTDYEDLFSESIDSALDAMGKEQEEYNAEFTLLNAATYWNSVEPDREQFKQDMEKIIEEDLSFKYLLEELENN